MVYKKYIKKGGKLYGPYYYHSKRVDGKVISEYHGIKKEHMNKKFLWMFIGAVVVVAIALGVIFSGDNITGRAVMDLDANYQQGKALEGTLMISLRQGELMPASSKVVFENMGNKYEYFLASLVSEEPMNGDFYLEGTSISGHGGGYGLQGISEGNPTVYFTLEVLSEEKAQEVILNNTENSSTESFTGIPITGQVTLGIENHVEGHVSFEEDFVLNLSQGQSVQLIHNSIRTDTEKLSDDMITLSVEENQVTVSTDYSEIKRGFGEDYLGDERKEIIVDLSGLNLSLQQGYLKVSIIYSQEEIVSLDTMLEWGSVSVESIHIEEPASPSAQENTTPFQPVDETIGDTENITKQIPPEPVAVLTQEEKNVLMNKFGNESIEITKAELKKDKLIIRYEFEGYWFEASYEVALSKEELDSQMNTDKIKWLKEIARSISQTEEQAQSVEELLGNYSID